MQTNDLDNVEVNINSDIGSSSHYLPEVLSTFRASVPSIEESPADATMNAEVHQNL
jgi:hypothetical protein